MKKVEKNILTSGANDGIMKFRPKERNRTLKNEQCRSFKKFLSNFGLERVIAQKDNNFVSEEMRELDFLAIVYSSLMRLI